MLDLQQGDLIIRTAEERDIKEIAHLDVLCFSDPWSEESFEKEIKSNKLALYIVAEAEGKIIGYAGVWLVAGEGHITNIAVHPNYRRKKVGEKIVKRMLDISCEKGVADHTLEVRVKNEMAINLYKKFGFYEAGLRKHYYADNGEDALIMNRSCK